jgi:cytoskeletal protein CcmA (bactofilin family)
LKAAKAMFTKAQNTPVNTPVPASPEGSATERRRSLLHEGITIKGEWTSDGIVEFGGTFVGDLTVDTLVLSRSGNITGNVRARNVTIEGTFDGTVSAIFVTVKASAKVTADIIVQSIAVEPGATIEGQISCKAGTEPG